MDGRGGAAALLVLGLRRGLVGPEGDCGAYWGLWDAKGDLSWYEAQQSIRLEHQGTCYSGYRAGQSPDTGVYPTAEQIEEDLEILVQRWRYIRLYDTGPHAELVLAAIERMGLDLEVLLGAWLAAEVNNPDCPDAHVSDEQLAENVAINDAEVARLGELARRFPASSPRSPSATRRPSTGRRTSSRWSA